MLSIALSILIGKDQFFMRAPKAKKPARRFRPATEQVEPRISPSTFFVGVHAPTRLVPITALQPVKP